MKGFFNTLIAVALGLLLATLIALVQGAQQEFEINQLRYQPLANARTAAAVIAEDIHDIIGVRIMAQEGNETIGFLLEDNFPPSNASLALAAYRDFIQNESPAYLHANFSLNTSNMSDGRAEITFFDDQLVYWKDYAHNRTLVSPVEGNTPYNYSGNITVLLTRALLDTSGLTWQADGFRVDLNYSDNNGSVSWNGYLDKTVRSRIRLAYTDNSTLDIYLGAMDSFQANTSLDLGTPGMALEGTAPADFFIRLRRPPLAPAQRWNERYNAWFVYNQSNASRAYYVERTG